MLLRLDSDSNHTAALLQVHAAAAGDVCRCAMLPVSQPPCCLAISRAGCSFGRGSSGVGRWIHFILGRPAAGTVEERSIVEAVRAVLGNKVRMPGALLPGADSVGRGAWSGLQP